MAISRRLVARPRPAEAGPDFVQVLHPHEITDELRRAAIDCWIEVSDAGGAAGFPFPPVDPNEVSATADAIIRDLDPLRSRLLIATVGGGLAGWLNIRRDPHPLVSHWGSLHHVQTRLDIRGQGIGAALMHRAREVARDEMGLEQLHLAARGGVGLEAFYGRLGRKRSAAGPRHFGSPRTMTATKSSCSCHPCDVGCMTADR